VSNEETGKMAALLHGTRNEGGDRSKHWANFNYSLKLSIKNFAARERECRKKKLLKSLGKCIFRQSSLGNY